MILPGLVSVTFRALSPREIVKLAAEAGLAGIEWGGDIHVPHGDLLRAQEARALTEDAGLRTSAYGSYYRAGSGTGDFAAVLETALALNSPTIRVWAGTKGSSETEEAERRRVEKDLLRIASLASDAGISVSCEYHADTLTDTDASARGLLDAVPHPGLFTYWQPPNGASMDMCFAGLHGALPRLSNIHVFHWWPTAADRLPLARGESRWRRYLAAAGAQPGPDGLRFASLEFVAEDSVEQFRTDARTLRRWLSEL